MFELTMNKRCKGPVERVFAAWGTADQVKRWFAPGDMSVSQAEIDFRVGGSYRIVIQRPDGQTHIVGGIYREIVTNERLSFTWSWEGSGVTSEVELSFRPVGAQTDLTLVHRQIPTAESLDSHQHGWESCLDKLVALD
ncbi:SRPBCC family protein [Collimonas silvisoli]|uniref:SRPBCC family protein n=1 Tax=Collimonas silvisoli TaxID=2825884 RepID=UPI001B8CE850|nr:SRPBCC family protein [Collimonas silvisoli]